MVVGDEEDDPYKEGVTRKKEKEVVMRKSILVTVVIVCSLWGWYSHPVEAKVLRWAYSADIDSLDPDALVNLEFLHHIYDPLVRRTNNIRLEPALATSWETVKPNVWRFKLRRGVKFHNGNSFNADDVVVSIKRALHPNSSIRGNIRGVVDIQKVDDYTVDFLMTGPYPLLPKDLVNIYMLDKEWMTENKCLEPVNPTKGERSHITNSANGTGAFMLESRQPEVKTVLKVNPNWWDTPKHNLTGIEFRPIASDATRVAALLTGEIDIMNPCPLQDIDRISRTKGFKVQHGFELKQLMLLLNHKDELNDSNIKGKNPLKDIRVRKALYQAIDIEAIHDKIMRGMSENKGAYIDKRIPGYDLQLEKRLPYDPSAAKRLLAEAGYPDGFEVGFDCPTNHWYINDEKIAPALASMWAKVGIKARLQAHFPVSNYFKKVRGEGKGDIWMLGWGCLPSADAYALLAEVLTKPREKLGAWNSGVYYNPNLEDLTMKIAVELDEPKRLKMITEAVKMAQDDVAVIPLHQQPYVWAMRDGVNIDPCPDKWPRLWWSTFD